MMLPRALLHPITSPPKEPLLMSTPTPSLPHPSTGVRDGLRRERRVGYDGRRRRGVRFPALDARRGGARRRQFVRVRRGHGRVPRQGFPRGPAAQRQLRAHRGGPGRGGKQERAQGAVAIRILPSPCTPLFSFLTGAIPNRPRSFPRHGTPPSLSLSCHLVRCSITPSRRCTTASPSPWRRGGL